MKFRNKVFIFFSIGLGFTVLSVGMDEYDSYSNSVKPADENSQRCNSLPFSLEGIPQRGPDPNIEYKGKLIDGIAHIFYPSGRLQRRGKMIDDNGNPDINGKATGVFEFFSDEDCFLVSKHTWKLGELQSQELFTNGTITTKSFYKDGLISLIEIYNYETITQKAFFKNGLETHSEIYTDGILSLRGPWKDNKPYGDWKSYDKSGTVTQIETFENGKKIKDVMIYPSITCGALVKDFEANEMRALRDHQNKTYIVSGKIDSIRAGILDEPTIHLSEGTKFRFKTCMASPAEGEEFYYDLNEGQLVEMQCTVTGEVGGTPTLAGCVLAN